MYRYMHIISKGNLKSLFTQSMEKQAEISETGASSRNIPNLMHSAIGT